MFMMVSKAAIEEQEFILRAFLQEEEARLPSLIKMIVWAQQQLDDKVVFPKIKDFFTAKLIEQPE